VNDHAQAFPGITSHPGTPRSQLGISRQNDVVIAFVSF
jgi:hypothetical protein